MEPQIAALRAKLDAEREELKKQIAAAAEETSKAKSRDDGSRVAAPMSATEHLTDPKIEEMYATAAEASSVRRIEMAEAFLKAAGKGKTGQPKNSGAMPGRYQPVAGPHPCLDPSVKPTHTAAGYTPLGGGQSTIYIKGNFICDYEGSFSILSGSELINYYCKRDGNRFVECKETDRDRLTKTIRHEGFTTYEFDNKKFWLDVYPAKK